MILLICDLKTIVDVRCRYLINIGLKRAKIKKVWETLVIKTNIFCFIIFIENKISEFHLVIYTATKF